MKNKKKQTIYWEDIFFPAEFRTKHTGIYDIPPWLTPASHSVTGWLKLSIYIPVIMTGWVQNECHLQVTSHSLN